jgi:hypothetical protein
MTHSTPELRRLLASRSVVVLFGLQAASFLVVVTAPVHGVDVLTTPVVAEAQFVNSFTDNVFAPGYNGPWDPLSTLFALPVVYYATAVVVAAVLRVSYRFVRNDRL